MKKIVLALFCFLSIFCVWAQPKTINLKQQYLENAKFFHDNMSIIGYDRQIPWAEWTKVMAPTSGAKFDSLGMVECYARHYHHYQKNDVGLTVIGYDSDYPETRVCFGLYKGQFSIDICLTNGKVFCFYDAGTSDNRQEYLAMDPNGSIVINGLPYRLMTSSEVSGFDKTITGLITLIRNTIDDSKALMGKFSPVRIINDKDVGGGWYASNLVFLERGESHLLFNRIKSRPPDTTMIYLSEKFSEYGSYGDLIDRVDTTWKKVWYLNKNRSWSYVETPYSRTDFGRVVTGQEEPQFISASDSNYRLVFKHDKMIISYARTKKQTVNLLPYDYTRWFSFRRWFHIGAKLKLANELKLSLLSTLK